MKSTKRSKLRVVLRLIALAMIIASAGQSFSYTASAASVKETVNEVSRPLKYFQRIKRGGNKVTKGDAVYLAGGSFADCAALVKRSGDKTVLEIVGSDNKAKAYDIDKKAAKALSVKRDEYTFYYGDEIKETKDGKLLLTGLALRNGDENTYRAKTFIVTSDEKKKPAIVVTSLNISQHSFSSGYWDIYPYKKGYIAAPAYLAYYDQRNGKARKTSYYYYSKDLKNWQKIAYKPGKLTYKGFEAKDKKDPKAKIEDGFETYSKLIVSGNNIVIRDIRIGVAGENVPAARQTVRYTKKISSKYKASNYKKIKGLTADIKGTYSSNADSSVIDPADTKLKEMWTVTDFDRDFAVTALYVRKNGSVSRSGDLKVRIRDAKTVYSEEYLFPWTGFLEMITYHGKKKDTFRFLFEGVAICCDFDKKRDDFPVQNLFDLGIDSFASDPEDRMNTVAWVGDTAEFYMLGSDRASVYLFTEDCGITRIKTGIKNIEAIVAGKDGLVFETAKGRLYFASYEDMR